MDGDDDAAAVVNTADITLGGGGKEKRILTIKLQKTKQNSSHYHARQL